MAGYRGIRCLLLGPRTSSAAYFEREYNEVLRSIRLVANRSPARTEIDHEKCKENGHLLSSQIQKVQLLEGSRNRRRRLTYGYGFVAGVMLPGQVCP